MAKIQYFTRSTVKNKIVDIRVRFRDGENVDLVAYTGLKVRTDHWSNATQTVKNIADATYKDEINEKLRELNNIILKEMPKGDAPTKEWLITTIDKFHNPEKYEMKQETLFTFIDDFITKAPTRINYKSGRPVCYKMQREYMRTLHYLKGFANEKKRTIDFNSIDLDFYHDFILYLQSKNLAQNTIGKKIQTLKIFLNAASDASVNHNMSYKSHRFAAISEETESIYLNEEELAIIFDMDLSQTPRLERVRDLFIVGCWTGLRFSDWSKVNPSNIHNGNIVIKQQQKTGKPALIPLHSNVIYLLEKYNNSLPKPIANQNFNKFLKEIAQMAGFNDKVQKTITRGGIKRTTSYKKWQLVTTHCARRSMATNLYNAGVPSITIMSITGHKTETSFLKYIRVTPEEHANKVREIWNRQAMKVVNE
jgi:site-specific recombinase XerD